jgi:hypothetical protein
MVNKTDYENLVKSGYSRIELCYITLMALELIEELNHKSKNA